MIDASVQAIKELEEQMNLSEEQAMRLFQANNNPADFNTRRKEKMSWEPSRNAPECTYCSHDPVLHQVNRQCEGPEWHSPTDPGTTLCDFRRTNMMDSDPEAHAYEASMIPISE